MNSAIERLVSLRVSDVMNPLPIKLAASQTIREAAGVFDEFEIGGAPVVDDDGRCVGVLSARDVVRYEVQRRGSETRATDGPATVASYMSSRLQALTADSPMTAAAREMQTHHIHRVIVVDDQGCPVGVITSLDITSAMVQALEE